jgi:methylated-DNA-[protein]-cysteine S-methyltransferase
MTPTVRPDFTARVLSVVRRIPRGRVATYGDVAALAGRPRAARAVGNIMRTCGRPDVPCHRVVAAGGRLGGYGGNEVFKRERLAAEGITFTGARIAGFSRSRVTAAEITRRSRLLDRASLPGKSLITMATKRTKRTKHSF